jgi:hypothetical protein
MLLFSQRGCFMNIKDKFVKILLVLLLGSVAINLGLLGAEKVSENKREWRGRVTNETPSVMVDSNTIFNSSSNLLGYLFQLMFILFFISPPLIVVMLYLIWQELKERNKMK